MSDLNEAREELEDSLDPENFDFDAVAVTEDEYYSFLDNLFEEDGVIEVKHNPAMNEVDVFFEPGTFGMNSVPNGLSIRSIREKDHEDFGECIQVSLSVRDWFLTEEDAKEILHANYSDEAMAFLKVQLDLFEQVESTHLVPWQDGELKLYAFLTEETVTSWWFNEIQTFMGYSISLAYVQEGDIRLLIFEFDNSREFNRESVDAFRHSKLRSWKNADFDSSNSINAPCGHEAEPELLSMKDITRDMFTDFPTTTINGLEFYKFDIKDSSKIIFKEIENWPEGTEPIEHDNGSVTVEMSRGYLCTECDTAYAPFDEEELRKSLSEGIQPEMRSVDTREMRHNFLVFPQPYIPTEFYNNPPEEWE